MIIQTVCPTCSGLGIMVRLGEKCHTCFGSGEVLYDDIHERVLPVPIAFPDRQNRGFYGRLNRSIHSLPEIDEDFMKRSLFE